MAVLLTGASGYLGSAVAARLTALGIAWQALPTRLEDIAPASLAQTTVIHCAGALRQRPADWQRVNVEGMARLLAGLRAPARLVFASSRAVYGAPFPAGAGMPPPWSEAAATLPQDGYGTSKLLAENLLRDSGHAGISCRLATLFGAAPRGDCPSLPNRALQAFRTGRTLRLLAQDIEVDYLAVGDAARLLVAIAQRADITEPAINLAGPRRSLHALIAALADACTSSAAADIVHDYPPGPVWPCLDTRLLRRLLSGFVYSDDRAATRLPV